MGIRKILYILVPCLLFMVQGAYSVSLKYDELLIEVLPNEKGIILKKGEDVFLRIEPGLYNGKTVTAPWQFESAGDTNGISFSGSFEHSIFSGHVVSGNGLMLFLRFYKSGHEQEGEFGLVLKGENVISVKTAPGINILEGYSLLLNSAFSSIDAHTAFLHHSYIHITGEDNSDFISLAIIKKDVPVPALLNNPHVPEKPEQYCPLDITCSIIDAMENPFLYRSVSCAVVSPSKKKIFIEPFFDQDFTFQNGTGMETGYPHFTFRYCPREKGVHHFEIKTQSRSLYKGKFNVAASKDTRGFVHTHKKSRYFKYDTGDVYFPVGINVCWAEDFRYYIDKLAEYGMNFMRVWLCSWSINVEGRKVNDFRLDSCTKLDNIFAYAREKNIKVMLCINNFYDFNNNKDQFGYFGQGGVCKEEKDFFTDEKCLEIRRNFLQYLVSRYSAYTSLLSWELWNEIDYAVSSQEIDIAEAENALAEFIHSIDPNNHPVTTSLGLSRIDHRLWSMDGIDTVQFHAYIQNHMFLPKNSMFYDSALFIASYYESLKAYKKPVLFSEIGHNGTNDYNPNNELDSEGILLHNSIWSSSLGGYSGSAFHWWWDVYIDRYDLYYHFKPLVKILNKFTFSDDVKPFGSESVYRGRVRVMGIKDKRNAVLWVQDKKATWGNILIYSYVPRSFKHVRFKAGRFNKDTYRITWFNTFSGKEIHRETLTPQKGMLLLKAPEFTRDCVCLIVPE